MSMLRCNRLILLLALAVAHGEAGAALKSTAGTSAKSITIHHDSSETKLSLHHDVPVAGAASSGGEIKDGVMTKTKRRLDEVELVDANAGGAGGGGAAAVIDDKDGQQKSTEKEQTQPAANHENKKEGGSDGEGEAVIVVTDKDEKGIVPNPPAAADGTGGGGGGDTTDKGTPSGTSQQQQVVSPPPDDSNAEKDVSLACDDAKTCLACQQAASAAESTTKGRTCWWEMDPDNAVQHCALVLQSAVAERKVADMCNSGAGGTGSEHANNAKPPGSENSSTTNPTDGGDDDEGNSGGSFTTGVMLVVFILVGAVAARFKLMQGHAKVDGYNDDTKSAIHDFGSILGSSRSKFSKNHHETVPLSRGAGSEDDDEEWGWEDSSADGNGDVEMMSSKKDDDEDLTMAFAVTRPIVVPKASPVVSRPMRSTPNIMPSTASSSSPSPSSYVQSPSPLPMQITSLGKKSSGGVAVGSNTGVSKTPLVQKQSSSADDDLFASMGLAARPTFKPGPSISGTTNTATAPRSGGSAALLATTADFDDDDDNNWDDDGDLDDLLKD